MNANRLPWSWLVTMLVVFAASSAWADEGDRRVVVLKVPGGGTEILEAKVDAVDGIEALGQGWFVNEVKARGIKTKGLMKRAKDLKWVMQGANVARLVYVDEDGGRYSVSLIGEDGEVRREFKLDQGEAGLSAEGADKVVLELRDDLGLTETPQIQEIPVVESPKPVETPAPKDEELEPSGRHGSEGWALEVGARLIKRDLGVNGSNGAVLTYPSQFYPGGDVRLSLFPGGRGVSGTTGLKVRAIVGMASVSGAADPGQVAQSQPVLHLEGELLADHRVILGLSQNERASVRFDIEGGARYVSYAIENGALPATAAIAVVLGAAASTRAISPDLTLRLGVQISPFSTWLTGADKFGESAMGYGMGLNVGGIYALTESLGFAFGWEARLDRTSFSGRGSLDYVDAEAFELVQGVTLGVVYAN